jgi:hypothetical protein
MAVTGTFVSFASSKIVAAPPDTDFAMGTYEKVAGLMANDRPVYTGVNGLYLCYTTGEKTYNSWMISADPCTDFAAGAYAYGTLDAPCPDQVAEFVIPAPVEGGLPISRYHVRVKQAGGTHRLVTHNHHIPRVVHCRPASVILALALTLLWRAACCIMGTAPLTGASACTDAEVTRVEGAEDDPSALIELMSTNAPCYYCFTTCRASDDSDVDACIMGCSRP